jgi:putative oxidoreductase
MADIDRSRDYGIAILRVGVGIVFLMHGWLKLSVFGLQGTIGFFTQVGVPLPNVMAPLLIALELVGGVALILGVFTRPFALGLMVDVIGAIYFTKLGEGFFAPKGYELELTLAIASAALVLTGGGALVLESLIRRRKT